ncbi:MAG: type VI secretion system tube protein Hcp [Acidobacteria bacterium]|nr:type VI secretion system tube protein Hcp [Acidobacteriota bacterium]
MAINMYLKFEDPGIEGSSTTANHAKEIEVLSWNHGFSQPTSSVRSNSGAGTVEQANHQNFTFSKYVDDATDDLLKMCWSGKQIGKATLTCYRADGAEDNVAVDYLLVEMQHIVVSNYNVSGGPGDIPVENIALDYGIVKYIYKPQKGEDGTGGDKVEIQHDLETRKIS